MHKKWAGDRLRKVDILSTAECSSIKEVLDRDDLRPIELQNWSPLEVDVRAGWKCLWGPDAFFIYFEIHEPWIRAVNAGMAGRVCQDSCVEWFFSFDEKSYYNIEVNPIGAFTIEKGASRAQRYHYGSEEFLGLRFWGTEGKESFDVKPSVKPWKVWMVIPYADLGLSYEQIKASQLRANFYKCGDHLPSPHYLTWAPVTSASPDFHLPQYFKILTLDESLV